jgi:hypothetical protein
MADDSLHHKLSRRLAFVHAEMDFNFRAGIERPLAQDFHAAGTHVGKKADGEPAAWAEQDAPVGGVAGDKSALG